MPHRRGRSCRSSPTPEAVHRLQRRLLPRRAPCARGGVGRQRGDQPLRRARERAGPTVEIGLFLAAIVFGARFVAPKALSAARRLSPDMNLLMVVAVLGAMAIGEFFEAASLGS